MSDAFDPHYKWLGIPPAEQPANYYRLLGLPIFESDLDVIENAADQRMAHVRKYQSGKHGALSQKLLNELSAARVCLLDPSKKAAYDAKLKAGQEAATVHLEVAAEPPARPVESPSTIASNRPQLPQSALPEPALPRAVSVKAAARPPAHAKPKWLLPAAIGLGVALLLLVGVTVIVVSGLFSSEDEQAAQTSDDHAPPGKVEKTKINESEGRDEQVGSTNITGKIAFEPPSADKLSQFGVKVKPKGYILLPAMAGLESQFTIEIWHRLTQIDGPEPIIGVTETRPGGSLGASWQLYADPSPDSVRLSFRHQRGSEKGKLIRTVVKRDELLNWHHIAVCKSANELRVFVNGKLTLTHSLQQASDPVPFRIGIAADPHQPKYFSDGPGENEVRGLRVSSTARYDGPFTPPISLEADPETVAQLDFSQPKLQRILDSQRKHDATLAEASWVKSDGSAVDLADDAPETSVVVQPMPPDNGTPPTPPEIAPPLPTGSSGAPEVPVADKKLAVPDQTEQTTARADIRAVFESQFEKAKRDGEAGLALAKELLAVANDKDVQPVNQFVLLNDAQALALDGGDIELAFEIAREIYDTFDVDGPQHVADLIAQARTKARLTAQREALAKQILEHVEWFMDEGRFDLASAAAKNAYSVATRPPILREVLIIARNKQQEINDLKVYWDRAEAAKLKLKVDPDDAPAHLAVGQYECFIRGNWHEGLAHLAKSGDAVLKAAAELELSEPEESNAQVSAGNAWWDAAQNHEGRIKDSLLLRARHWYEQALPNASALAKLRLKERLEQTEDIAKAHEQAADRFTPAARGIADMHGFIGHVTNGNQRLPILARYPSGTVYMRQPVYDWLNSHNTPSYSSSTVSLQGILTLDETTEVTIYHSAASTSYTTQVFIDGKAVSQTGGGQPAVSQSKHRLSKGSHAVAWAINGSVPYGVCDFLDEDGSRIHVEHDQRLLQQAGAQALPEQLWLGQGGDVKSTIQMIGLFLQAGGRVTISELNATAMRSNTIQNVNEITSPYFRISSMYLSSSTNQNFGDPAMVIFNGNAPIESLRLPGTRITDAGLVQLAGLTGLRTLALENSPGITGEGLKSLGALTGLQSLDLKGTRINDKTLEYCKQFPGLTTIMLQNTAVTDKGIAILAELPALRSLYIGSPAFNETAFSALAALRQIGTLHLENVAMTDKAFQSLSQCGTLENLYIQNAQVSAESFQHLVKLASLDYLSLYTVRGVTPDSFEHIAKIPGLETLRLYYIPTIANDSIAKLQGSRQLQTIYLYKTGVNQAGALALKQALPGTRIYHDGQSL